jgi:hypothetical protein
MLNNKFGREKQGICTAYRGIERITERLDVSRSIQPSQKRSIGK